MIDEWGEEVLEEINDEGVFDESALGDSEAMIGAPQGSAAPQVVEKPVTKQYVKMGPNRYAVYEVDQATAGLGGPPGSAPGASYSLPYQDPTQFQFAQQPGYQQPYGYQQQQPMTPEQQRAGMVGGAIGQGIQGALNIMGGITSSIMGVQEARASREQAAQQFNMQMQVWQEQLSQARSQREQDDIRSRMDAAQGAFASGDTQQLMALMAQAQRTPTWVYVAGIGAFLAVGGLIVWALTKDDEPRYAPVAAQSREE